MAVVVDVRPTQLRAGYHSLGQAAEAAGPPAMPVQHQVGSAPLPAVSQAPTNPNPPDAAHVSLVWL